MHHIDLGLFKYMLDYMQELLNEQCENWVIDEFNNRLAAIPKFPELKIFNNGITAVKTANEYRMIMKVIISVLDGLFDDKDLRIRKQNRNSNHPYISSVRLTRVFLSFIRMYMISRKKEFSENDLDEFEVNDNEIFLQII